MQVMDVYDPDFIPHDVIGGEHLVEFVQGDILPGNGIHNLGMRNRGGQLRGYQPANRNEKLVSKQRTISNETIISYLNSNNLMYCQIEIYSDTHMPTREFRIFPQNISDFEILNDIITGNMSNPFAIRTVHIRNITEIHVTPVYQSIAGFPKVFTDADNSISVLTTLKKSADAAEIGA